MSAGVQRFDAHLAPAELGSRWRGLGRVGRGFAFMIIAMRLVTTGVRLISHAI